MRVSHSVAAVFDDPNLISCAGLAPPMALARRCGLGDLVAGKTPRTRPRVQPMRVSMDRESTGVRRPAAAAAGIPGATQAAHAPMTVANPPGAPIRHTF